MARTTRVQMNDYEYDYEVGRQEFTTGRSQTEAVDRSVDESQVVQGTVLWLPAREDLPERAVRRAHGKGAIEEGIFNHPVVVVSRPEEDSQIIHFHLITSLQGRRLEQLYSKSNEFHASRRSWFLPVAPTPSHPDAVSKKTKKRFPTLILANGATLRWDSYVNIRHVYKIDISLLRAYSNPDTPTVEVYHFERESTIRMLAKGKSLTLYEPGPQFVGAGLQRTRSEPTPTTHDAYYIAMPMDTQWPSITAYPPPPTRSSQNWSTYPSPNRQPDFHISRTEAARIPGTPPKVPPDGGLTTLATVYQSQLVIVKAPVERAWRDLKGVTAIAIASL
ncbi:hypothetical protein HBI12_072410 [Parastagonospora nodorum]|nr:hypothetical protein HBI12_072410 [Parastagonospora nodorum]